MNEYVVLRLEEERIERAMVLVWRVFREFEATEYSARGIGEFRRYILTGER